MTATLGRPPSKISREPKIQNKKNETGNQLSTFEQLFLYYYKYNLMSAKHQENDTPVKASHLLLVIAVCQVLVPEHCLLGEPPKHEKFVSFHKSSVEW